MTDPVPDRRAALKERSRQAILAAAHDLMRTTGGISFTVDELADRADVSRRTVFNHFASLDDVVAEVCSGILGDLVANLAASMTGAERRPGESILDELIATVRGTDLVGPMAYLTRTLGGSDPRAPRQADLLTRAVSQVGAGLVEVLGGRYPEVDPLDLRLLVSTVTGGVLVLHLDWWERTGARDDADSRAVWDSLLDRLVTHLRTGFGAVS